MRKDKNGVPNWVMEPPTSSTYVYGIGSSKMTTLENSIKSAESKARANLATNYTTVEKQISKNYQIDVNGSNADIYEALSVEITNQQISRVEEIDRYISPEGSVWILMGVKRSKLN